MNTDSGKVDSFCRQSCECFEPFIAAILGIDEPREFTHSRSRCQIFTTERLFPSRKRRRPPGCQFQLSNQHGQGELR